MKRVPSSKARKLIAAREDLVERAMEVARRRNMTFYGLVNEALEQLMRVDEMGTTLKEVVDAYEILDVVKRDGFIIVVEGLLYDVVEEAVKVDERRAMKRWYEVGQWYGKYYAARQPNDPLEALVKALRALTWGVADLHVMKDDNGDVIIRCASRRFPSAYTELLNAFMDGAMHPLGYKVKRQERTKGVIMVEFERTHQA